MRFASRCERQNWHFDKIVGAFCFKFYEISQRFRHPSLARLQAALRSLSTEDRREIDTVSDGSLPIVYGWPASNRQFLDVNSTFPRHRLYICSTSALHSLDRTSTRYRQKTRHFPRPRLDDWRKTAASLRCDRGPRTTVLHRAPLSFVSPCSRAGAAPMNARGWRPHETWAEAQSCGFSGESQEQNMNF